jgi:hypothetical protein
MVDVNEEQWVTDRLARRMYLRYCEEHDRRPFRRQYAPPWAKDYASVAVSVLGYDDEAVRRLADANDPVVTP